MESQMYDQYKNFIINLCVDHVHQLIDEISKLELLLTNGEAQQNHIRLLLETIQFYSNKKHDLKLDECEFSFDGSASTKLLEIISRSQESVNIMHLLNQESSDSETESEYDFSDGDIDKTLNEQIDQSMNDYLESLKLLREDKGIIKIYT